MITSGVDNPSKMKLRFPPSRFFLTALLSFTTLGATNSNYATVANDELAGAPQDVLAYSSAVNPPSSVTMSTQPYSLPKLPYAYNALEPAISAQIMELHHSKHHQTYVTSLNNALQSYAVAQKDNNIPNQIALQSALRFHGGGHINHSLFWQNLAPPTSNEAKMSSAPKLSEAIKKTYGDEKVFKEKFNAALLGIQGSGWGWLVKFENEGGRLGIVTTKDQDPIVGPGEVPIFGVDMWEHAYYLQYLNGKASYVENIWKVINWKTAEERYLGKRDDAFKILKASM